MSDTPTPAVEVSDGMKELVNAYANAIETWHTAEAGEDAGAAYLAIQPARQTLLDAIAKLEHAPDTYWIQRLNEANKRAADNARLYNAERAKVQALQFQLDDRR